MSTNIQKFLDAGLSVIPIKDKIPSVAWKEFQTRQARMGELSFNGSLGLVCGFNSVEAVDIDSKNDPTLLDRLEKTFNDFDVPRYWVVQKTPSGGLHLVYKCEKIEGNQILAKSNNQKVLIETRGIGGYIAIAPTPGYELRAGTFEDIPTITIEERDTLLSACRSLNEYYEPIASPKYTQTTTGAAPWEDYNERGDIPSLLQSHNWTYLRTVGGNQHYCRPDKNPKGTSGTWSEGKRLFHCFTSSTMFEPSKAYSPTAVFAYLECNKDFSEANKRLMADGFGKIEKHEHKSSSPKILTEPKHYKKYIITEEPKEEVGIIYINGVNVLSEGNILAMTGPMKGRKTMLASVLVNQSGLKAAYIDTEQGRKHSYRTGQYTPTADVYHLRGEDKDEIKRVVDECVNSREYELLVLDNIRDMLGDFNNVQESGEIELYLKKVSEKIPTIAILHENKNSTKGQGHLGHGIAKIAQTTIRVQLADIEDPSKGSFVECVHTRDEPFKRAFLSMEGVLSADDFVRSNGKSISQEAFLNAFDNGEFSSNEVYEKIVELFDVKPTSAVNVFATLRKAWPSAFTERKEGKKKFYNVSSMPK